ncbi:hypothetical protein F7731_18640 [Cytobacillus depressus]|uniref:Uncharacterized protein n=1 Tax=Cytobacillus depressus TaxID=1602942 RepID=A0A6L3V348_9BACI|nr:hypothetical protein [Cytobacillus depressus]KAB2331591.1 hypothetical protein F7731_18640 [Cytobacillus depressus]
MKNNKFKLFTACIIVNLIFTAGCSNDEREDVTTIDVDIAHDKLLEEVVKKNNLLIQNGIELSSIWADEQTETLHVGLLKINKRTEKKFKTILFDEILQGSVKLNLFQEEPIKLH